MIKLIDYGPGVKSGKKPTETIYIDKKDISIMIGKNDGQYDREYTYLLVRGGSTHYIKETPEEILAMPDIETSEKVIDWEQRRFDLVSALFVKYACSPDNLPYLLNDIIPQADALINELKKGQDND